MTVSPWQSAQYQQIWKSKHTVAWRITTCHLKMKCDYELGHCPKCGIQYATISILKSTENVGRVVMKGSLRYNLRPMEFRNPSFWEWNLTTKYRAHSQYKERCGNIIHFKKQRADKTYIGWAGKVLANGNRFIGHHWIINWCRTKERNIWEVHQQIDWE